MQFLIKGFTRVEFYPIAEIDRMQRSWTAEGGTKQPGLISFKDGREIQVDDEEIDRIVRQSTPIVPALPGDELLTFGYLPEDDEPGPWVHRDPIIGWRDAQYGGLDPVVIDYDFTEMEARHAILLPSGRVQLGESWFDSEQEWVADMKARRDAELARKRAAAAQEEGGGDGSQP